MAGDDGGQRLWDLSRRAASFLRMARLALTGAPAHMVTEEEVIGGKCYRSVSTVEDNWESDELWLDEDESELLVDDNDDDDDVSRRTRGVSENSTHQFIGPLSKKPQFVGRRPVITASAAALRPEDDDAAVAESSEPLVPRGAAKRGNDAETVHHPFGCDRRGSESSSLLLVSS